MQADEQFVKDTLASLATRQRKKLKIAHVLHDATGFYMLDIDISAPTLAELQECMLVALEAIPADSIMKPAPEARWREFLDGGFVESKLVSTPLGRRGIIGIFVRSVL